MTVTIGPATLADINHVGANLREADEAEMRECGLSVEDTTNAMRSALSGETVFAVRADADPIMVYGLGPNGYVWALGTPGVSRHSRAFLRTCSNAILQLRAIAGVSLWTVAWRGNPVHLRWLQWCGFDDLGDHSPDRPLMMRRDHV